MTKHYVAVYRNHERGTLTRIRYTREGDFEVAIHAADYNIPIENDLLDTEYPDQDVEVKLGCFMVSPFDENVEDLELSGVRNAVVNHRPICGYPALYSGKWYLVRLCMDLDGYEKDMWHVVYAQNAQNAGTQALINECHTRPDFEGHEISRQQCNDGDHFTYTVSGAVELTDEEAETYHQLQEKYREHN